HLLEAWGQRFNLQLDEGAHMALFRYPNRPGMLGRVGSVLGAHGINISTATQGVQQRDNAAGGDINVMLVLTDTDIPAAVLDAVLAVPGVIAGRTVRI
ncbi:MAG: ACT domain-containing protein, partial [Chloroflexota bacterium]|nr:ACT domain-containing protein [Chloroflexota bacterium]